MKITEKYVRWIGIPLITLVLPFATGHADQYLKSLIIAFLFTFTLWNGNAFITFWLRGKFPGFAQTQKRIIYLILVSGLYSFITVTILSLFVCTALKEGFWNTGIWLEDLNISFYILTIILTLYESTYLFSSWKQSILETEKLKTQNLRSQFEVLKHQVSPHFLFNSLNTLISIIPENSDLAVKFTDQLSKVYRYILQNKDKELVTLETELNFIKSYIFLLKIRFGENLFVNYDIDSSFLRTYVAPLTLQMLVENAIKHNIVSANKPLHIDIYIDNGKSIIVKNNLQRKNSIQTSTKIGLENIQKRYQLLSNQAIDIITTTQNFMVALPLIRLG